MYAVHWNARGPVLLPVQNFNLVLIDLYMACNEPISRLYIDRNIKDHFSLYYYKICTERAPFPAVLLNLFSELQVLGTYVVYHLIVGELSARFNEVGLCPGFDTWQHTIHSNKFLSSDVHYRFCSFWPFLTPECRFNCSSLYAKGAMGRFFHIYHQFPWTHNNRTKKSWICSSSLFFNAKLPDTLSLKLKRAFDFFTFIFVFRSLAVALANSETAENKCQKLFVSTSIQLSLNIHSRYWIKVTLWHL